MVGMGNDDSKGKCGSGFDLGGTKMLCQLLDSGFSCLSRHRNRTRGFEGAEAGVNRIINLIRHALDDIDLPPAQLGGICIGCPGPLDLDEGVIIDSPNLGWKDIHLKKILEKEFGCPALILNDVDAGVYGEYRFGAGRDSRCLLGVFPGTGIGGGCVYGGEIFRGRTGSAMEVGHMQVTSGGPLCGCGRRGCLEAVSSRLAISSAATQAAYRGDAPYLMKKFGSDLSNIRSKALLESIEHGDDVIKDIVQNAARQIGIAVGNLVNVLLPDTVVLGGGLVEAMPDLFVNPVRKSANKRVMPSFESTFKVVPAKLGDDAAVLGAAAWAQHVIEGK